MNSLGFTPSEAAESEYTVRGSRFIGVLAPKLNTTEHNETIRTLRAQHPKAVHVCSAFRGLPGEHGAVEEACSDDGEPKGSSGPPILARLKGRPALGAGIYVVRYYGGTKLGVGGLVRAYGGVASDLVQMIDWEPWEPQIELEVELDYSEHDRFVHAMKAFGYTSTKEAFAHSIRLTIRGPQKDLDELKKSCGSSVIQKETSCSKI